MSKQQVSDEAIQRRLESHVFNLDGSPKRFQCVCDYCTILRDLQDARRENAELRKRVEELQQRTWKVEGENIKLLEILNGFRDVSDLDAPEDQP